MSEVGLLIGNILGKYLKHLIAIILVALSLAVLTVRMCVNLPVFTLPNFENVVWLRLEGNQEKTISNFGP